MYFIFKNVEIDLIWFWNACLKQAQLSLRYDSMTNLDYLTLLLCHHFEGPNLNSGLKNLSFTFSLLDEFNHFNTSLHIFIFLYLNIISEFIASWHFAKHTNLSFIIRTFFLSYKIWHFVVNIKLLIYFFIKSYIQNVDHYCC